LPWALGTGEEFTPFIAQRIETSKLTILGNRIECAARKLERQHEGDNRIGYDCELSGRHKKPGA
jgi:hypothetical protein